MSLSTLAHCSGVSTVQGYRRLADDLEFKRKHPFLKEWKEWERCVILYNSMLVKATSAYINKGFYWHKTVSQFELPEETQIIFNKIAVTVNNVVDKIIDRYVYETEQDEMKVRSKKYHVEFRDMRDEHYLNCPCDKGLGEKCPLEDFHVVVNLLGHLWAKAFIGNYKRSIRRYYARLERIILSVPAYSLVNFDMSLINEPEKYVHYGRKLMRELYSRAYFEKFDLDKMPFDFEYLKHFRVATQQCSSGDFNDKIIQIVKEQGFSHEINLSDAAVVKIQNLVKESQDSFMSSLSKTLMLSASKIMVLFIVATTVGLLAKAMAELSILVIVKILNLIYGFLMPSQARKLIVEQSREGLSIPLLPAIITDYVIAPPATVLEKLWKNPHVDLVMRRIGYVGDPKIHAGIDTLTEWAKSLIYKTVNWFRCEILGLSPIEDLESQRCALDTWNAECDDLVSSYYANEMVWTDSTWSVLMSLYSRGVGFTRVPVYYRYKNDIWKMVMKLGNLLEKFSQRMRSNQSVRNPPVTIYMCGDSGVGKSSVTYPFAVEILKGIFQKEKNAIDLEKQWKNLIYMRSAEQEFWDGYENQLVTVFDDFNQLIDSTSSPNVELFEIIRASNCFPYPLHMAALDQKANTTFNSKIIIASSNLQKPKTASLNFPTALFRRFDICFRVTRKTEGHSNEFDPLLFEFQQYNMVTGQLGEFVGYKELILLAVDTYFKRKGFVDSVDKYIANTLKDYKKSVKEQGLENFMYRTKAFYNNTQSCIQETCRSIRDFLRPDSVKNIFYDFREGIEHLKQSRAQRTSWWDTFRKDHKYLISATTFVGIIGLCFAVVKAIGSFMLKPRKEKVMTLKQFDRIIQSESVSESSLTQHPRNARVESTIAVHPVKVKAESINNQQPVKAKVESTIVQQPVKVKAESTLVQQPIRAKIESVVKEEGTYDVNASEVLMKVVRNNLYKIKDVNTDSYIGHVLFLKGRICLMPHHYLHSFDQIYEADNNSEIEFDGLMLSRTFKVKTFDLIRACKTLDSPPEGEEIVISRDIMFCEVKTAIFHCDVTKQFVSRENMSYVNNVKAYLPVLVTNDIKKSSRPILLVRFVDGKSQVSAVEDLLVTNAAEQPMRKIRYAWSYNMDTKPTECGAPLIVRNPLITPGKICGMHIAGTDYEGTGYSTPIYSEDIQTILNNYDFVPEIKQRLLLGPIKEQGVVTEDMQFLRLGTLDKPIQQPTKSKIRRSLSFGKIQTPLTRPCLLHETDIDGEKFNPRVYRLEKLGKESVSIPQIWIDQAAEAVEDFMVSKLQKGLENPNVKPVYSFREAVQGIDGSLYINSLKRSSSPGFPFVQMQGFATKSQIFGNDEKFDLENTQALKVKEMVDAIINSAKQQIVLDHYFCDTLKDERKPIFKSHKTRLFSAGSLDYLIACKMYFNGIVALLESNKNFCGVSVGTNVYSQDWDDIGKILISKSPFMLAGDFEGFDASEHVAMLEACGHILINLSKRCLKSTEEDCLVMRVLLVSLFNSRHIVGDEVYQWTHSLPSGHYLTAIINSIFVLLAFVMVWGIAFDNFDYFFLRMFFEECGIVAYGDDHVVSVPQFRLSAFNQFRLPEYFKIIGLNYTMEDKEATVKALARKLFEISYLKRSFSYHKKLNRIIGPLSMDTVLETPMWMHNCPDARMQTIENLEWAIRELSLHKKDVWNKWFPILEGELLRLGHVTMFKKKEEVLKLVLEF